MSGNGKVRFEWDRRRTLVVLLAVGAIALLLRTGGLFRGLDAGYTFHPDETKQITALGNFLDGRYVWYRDSLFYDGYPLGLNHVDEWVLRPVLAVRRFLMGHLQPGSNTDLTPDKLALFYWARSLRVLYGLCGVMLAYVVARRLWPHRGTALAVAALVAVAPLPAVVTHSATGDIGTDLFAAFVLLCLCRYSEGSRRLWLAGAGLAAGLAFACKYNGALAGLAVAAFICLEGWRDRRPIATLRSGFAAASGFLIGVVILTPAFLINRQRTWKDMRANFEFIRNYDVSDAFLAKPAFEKITLCLAKNTSGIIAALGWILTLLALAGLILATLSLWKAWTARPSAGPNRNRPVLFVSLLVFPLAALLLALAGKPEVQPFHFSWLQLPLTLGAVHALWVLWFQPARWGRVVAAGLFLAAAGELGWNAGQDLFFWKRGDNLRWKEAWPSSLLRDGVGSAAGAGVVKSVYLEPSGRAVFRNRASTVVAPHADFWNRMHVAPVPTVPGPVDEDWIFPNGPVFPRDDRLFKVVCDSTALRQVVFYAIPGEVVLGFRSGSWPVAVTVEFGGETGNLVLAPNTQQTLRLTPRRWRHGGGNSKFPQGSFIVPLSVRTQTGAAWVSVMTDEREYHLFQLFGGQISDRSLLQPSDVPSPELIDEMDRMRYLEGKERGDISADDPLEMAHRFPKEGVALPCGPFMLQCVIRSSTDEAEVTVKLDDFHQCGDLAVFEETFRLRSGVQVVTSHFSKAFAPYEGQIEVLSKKGNCRVEGWTLTPDTARIRDDLRQWADGGAAPAWLGSRAGAAPARSGPDLRFGNRIRLTRLSFPNTLRPTEKVPIFCAMELERFGWPHFEDYTVFIHLLDGEGHMAHDFHFPLWQAVALGALNRPIMGDAPASLAPGDYDLILGAYNHRTGKRLSIQGEGLSARERNKSIYLFGRTTVSD